MRRDRHLIAYADLLLLFRRWRISPVLHGAVQAQDACGVRVCNSRTL